MTDSVGVCGSLFLPSNRKSDRNRVSHQDLTSLLESKVNGVVCHWAIYGGRSRAEGPPRLGRVGPAHPLRLVVFNETPADAATVARWIDAVSQRFRLRSRREHVRNRGRFRGK